MLFMIELNMTLLSSSMLEPMDQVIAYTNINSVALMIFSISFAL